MVWIRKSISFLSLNEEKENLKDGLFLISLGTTNFNTCDPLSLPDWQALPFEQAIPFKSN
jgi:hypothetical protein